MQVATIKLFLSAGDAAGIRTAEILNWTGKAIEGNTLSEKQLSAILNSSGVLL